MVRDILIWPSPLLRKKCEKVEGLVSEDLVRDLIETMDYNRGLGLAAPQVGILLRVFVMRTSTPFVVAAEPKELSNLRVCVNPRILRRPKDRESMPEGCLSLPGLYENIDRCPWVEVAYEELSGKTIEETLYGRESQCFQHELDHLNGKMYPDRMDPGAKDRIRQQMRTRTWRDRL